MKSFSVLKHEQTGAIALANRNRVDYLELLDSGYVEVFEGGRSEGESFIQEYFNANNVAFEEQLYLTLQ